MAALFLCDGAFGSVHLYPGPAATADSTEGFPSFTEGATDAGEQGGEYPGEPYYAITLLVVVLGAVFRLRLFGAWRWRSASAYRSFERRFVPALLRPERRSALLLPVLRL